MPHVLFQFCITIHMPDKSTPIVLSVNQVALKVPSYTECFKRSPMAYVMLSGLACPVMN